MKLAQDDVMNSIEMAKSSPIEAQIFFKRLKVYVDSYILNNETYAIDQFLKEKRKEFEGVTVSLSTGPPILDYNQDMIYDDLDKQLKDRKALLDLAHKRKDPVFDEDGAQVPKVKIKGYRKDSLNVRL